MKRENFNNIELWKNFKHGDQNAFHLIYHSNYKILVIYGNKIVRDNELVKDVIHDLFLNLWLRRLNLSDTDNIIPYLKTCLRNDLIRKINESRNSISFDCIMDYDYNFERHQINQVNDVEEQEEQEEVFMQLDNAIKTLPKRVSETLKMKYFDRMGNQEIAKRMNINYQSVNNNIHRGVESLRKVLN